MKRIQRVISSCLIICLLISMMPVAVFAEDVTGTTEAVIPEVPIITEPTGATEEQAEETTVPTESSQPEEFDEIQQDNPDGSEDDSPAEEKGYEIIDYTKARAYDNDGCYVRAFFNNVELWRITRQNQLIIHSAYENYLPAHRDEPEELPWGSRFNFPSHSEWDMYDHYISIITVEEGIQQIGNYAFACDPDGNGPIASPGIMYPILSNVSLPSTLQSIGNYAFSGIKSLTYIILPEHLSSIGQNAFKDCSALHQIRFLGNAPKIASNAFTNVTATAYYPPDNATWTDAVMQDYGGDITWIPLGSSINLSIQEQYISTDPLICGSVITDAGKTGWQIPLKVDTVADVTVCLINLTLPAGFSFKENELDTQISQIPLGDELTDGSITLPTIYPIYVDKANQTESGEYRITVEAIAVDQGGKEINCTESLIFYRPIAINNAPLSVCSFPHNVYAFSLDTVYGGGMTYNKETARLCAMLSHMAYDNRNLADFLTAGMGLGFSDLETRGFPDNGSHLNEIGRHYAFKKIIVDGEIKNLVYVICRGTVGLKEWTSNMIVGLGNLHHGFSVAAREVETELEQYCKKRGFTSKDTIFLVTGHSRGAAVANLVGHWLNTEAGLAKKENISVYTFATPTVDKTIIHESSGYVGNENIFNFVNYQDPIRNAASMQYYGRYGSTTIFAFETADEGEQNHYDGYLSYTLPSNSNFTMPELLNSILFSYNPGTQYAPIVADIAFLLDMRKFLYGDDSSLGEVAQAHDMAYYYQAVVNNASDSSFTSVNQRTRKAYEFFNESYRNFLKYIGDHPHAYFIYKFCCPINLYVYDTNSNLVASIIDKQVICNDDNLTLYVDGDSLNVGMLEYKRDYYTIQVEGYDNGTMKHCIQTIGVDGFESIQLREDIPIEKNGVLELNDGGYVVLPGESEADAESAYGVHTDETEIEEILTRLNHDHEYTQQSITEATCTEKGYTTYVCSCGTTSKDDFVDALGHTGEWTPMENGEEENRICERCGEEEIRTIGGRLVMDPTVMGEHSSVWIDGVEYPVVNQNGQSVVILPEGDSFLAVTYRFHEGDPDDIHTQYPVSMQVWTLDKQEDGSFTATHVEELDNILQYSGSSIRITGVKGIRMITSVESGKKSALTTDGLAGYKLLEYGTVLAWASALDENNPLVLGPEYAKSNYAYKKDVADPVFAYAGDLVQYTNVLVGFTTEQCVDDIAMRPYMILEDESGAQITLYGGIVYRSIGYIAWQNRTVFSPGNAAYDYVWEIIHHVYGDKYDEDYKG